MKRLDRDIERRKQEVAKLSGKLSNEAFVARAPAEIVATEQQKLDQAESALSTLQRQRTQIEELRSD
jgi:valyl-tRNA synthetase